MDGVNNNQSEVIERPFSAYDGEEPYIFVSYAHKDAEIVFPEIKRFHQEGYNIWYDQGLTPGQEWDDEVAEALLSSSLVVVFISKNSMASSNVQDEIKLALDEKIDVVPIYFEETKLPPGLRLRLSNKHAIFKYSLSDDDYISDCFKAFKKLMSRDEDMKGYEDEIPKTEKEHVENNNANDVIIVHSSKDSKIANEVLRVLEKNDLKCWIAPRDLKTGINYAEQISNAIKNSKMALCIFSINAQESSYVKNEVNIAFSNNKNILSFKIDDFEPRHKMEFFLKTNPWVNGYPNPENHLNELTDEVKTILGISNDMKEDNSLITRNDLSYIDRDIAQKKNVYVCYDKDNQDIADSVCSSLEEFNFKCWLKSRDLGVGHIADEIVAAIKDSDIVVLIFSRYAKSSNFVNTEIDMSFSEQKPIIVFKVDDSKLDGGLEFFLNSKHWIDASSDYRNYLYTLVKDTYQLVTDPYVDKSHKKDKSPKKSRFKSLRSLFK